MSYGRAWAEDRLAVQGLRKADAHDAVDCSRVLQQELHDATQGAEVHDAAEAVRCMRQAVQAADEWRVLAGGLQRCLPRDQGDPRCDRGGRCAAAS